MDALKRNQTSAAQAVTLENGTMNPFKSSPTPLSGTYRKLLTQCRNLPVSRMRQEFLDMYHRSQTMVLSSQTGSGKSTQIPQFVLFDEFASGLGVVCTQPRVIAARSVAEPVAEEMDVKVAQQVGYQVRIHNHTSGATALTYMTEGILLRQLQSDKDLKKYSCVIVDKVYEIFACWKTEDHISLSPASRVRATRDDKSFEFGTLAHTARAGPRQCKIRKPRARADEVMWEATVPESKIAHRQKDEAARLAIQHRKLTGFIFSFTDSRGGLLSESQELDWSEARTEKQAYLELLRRYDNY